MYQKLQLTDYSRVTLILFFSGCQNIPNLFSILSEVCR